MSGIRDPGDMEGGSGPCLGPAGVTSGGRPDPAGEEA